MVGFAYLEYEKLGLGSLKTAQKGVCASFRNMKTTYSKYMGQVYMLIMIATYLQYEKYQHVLTFFDFQPKL